MRASVFTLALGCLAAATPAAAEVSARAEAGLAGVGRAGRWTPIVVTIENTGRAIDATITVTLDGERTVRTVALAAPSRKRLEFFLRAPDTDVSVAHVEISAPGEPPVSTKTPLRIAATDVPFTLCIARNGITSPGGRCTTTVETGALPASWRGFDAVDDVLWPDGITVAALETEQRTALERATAVRTFNNSTAMAPQWPRLSDQASQPSVVSRPLTFYTLLLCVLAVALSRVARRPARSYAVAACAIAAGTGAVIADGRYGAPARVGESTVIRAGEGFDGAQVLVRASVVFSSARPLDVRSELDDVHGLDSDAMAGARAHRGQRLTFEANGFASTAPVAVQRRGGTLVFENRLTSALTDCTLPAGSIARIAAGASAEIPASADVTGDVMVCRVERPAPHFSLPGGNVVHDGQAVLLLHLGAGGASR